jgi:xanthine dehydrogenase accessory factor
MKEREQILRLWDTLREAGESAVLVTVVKTQGSSYRLPGARLLIAPDGRHAGSVSGGCLEDDLLKKAWWLTEKGPLVRRYDTTADGEISEGGYGLGCNGIVHVLLERLSPPYARVLETWRQVCTVRQSASVMHQLAPSETPGLSKTWVETLEPPLRLLICGAGADAVPLSELARYLGWQVYVFDGRAHYARAEKFPLADRVIASNTRLAEYVDPWTAAVIMTHSYRQDGDILKQLAALPLRYLGVLGPRQRALQLLRELALDGSSVHSPMGLDIGADGPEQVALAVVAEIQATLNGRSGGALRARLGPIHAPEALTCVENS